MTRHAVHLGGDPLVAGRLTRLGPGLDLEWVDGSRALDPALVVLDLGPPEALAALAQVRDVWPRALVAGYLAQPDPDRWLAAQRAGADLVVNRGALAGRLRALLEADRAGLRRTFPVLAEADLAGRLGLVAQLDEGPGGDPVAIFQIDGVVHVVADSCPHAGSRLSDGELDHRILTCPRHGSQFDVATGERVRGPADCGLSTYKVVIESGQIAVLPEPVAGLAE